MMISHFPLRHSFVVLIYLLLTACTNSSSNYQKSGSIQVITVPEDLSSEPLEPLYPIPEVAVDDFNSNEEFEVPRPSPIERELSDSGVKIQRLGERSWILVSAPTAQVWPRTQNFFSRRGISIDRSVASLGLLETDWLKFSTDGATKNKFRLWVEQGVKAGTTEIHVVQMSENSQLVDGQIEWPEKSDDAEREAWLLNDLATSLVASVGNNSASLMGQNVGGEIKAQIVSVAQEPVLRLALDYERAWATLTQALGKKGFVLWQENSQAGVAYVGYAEPQEEQSFLQSMFGANKNNSVPKEAPQPLDKVLNHLAGETKVRALFDQVPGSTFNEEALPDALGFLVVITTKQSALHVHMRDSRGRQLPTKTAKQMLQVVRSNLI